MKKFKQHLISASLTFSTVFFLTIALAINVPEFQFNKQSIVAIALAGVIAGVRALAKFIVEWLMPEAISGKK